MSEMFNDRPDISPKLVNILKTLIYLNKLKGQVPYHHNLTVLKLNQKPIH
jgi:hypothetical protein